MFDYTLSPQPESSSEVLSVPYRMTSSVPEDGSAWSQIRIPPDPKLLSDQDPYPDPKKTLQVGSGSGSVIIIKDQASWMKNVVTSTLISTQIVRVIPGYRGYHKLRYLSEIGSF